MLCCVYTVINKLGLTLPEASPTPAQTVQCYQTLFSFQTLLNGSETFNSQLIPKTPVSDSAVVTAVVAVGSLRLASVVVVTLL